MYRNILFYSSITLITLVAITFSIVDGFLVKKIINIPELTEELTFMLLFATGSMALVLYPRRGRFGHMLFLGSFMLMNVFGYNAIESIFIITINNLFPWISMGIKVLGVGCILIATADLYIDFSNAINRLKLRNSELAETMHTDGLSKLFNRKYLEEVISSESFVAEKTNYSLIVLDIDNFKSVNDTYGHSIGDEVIKQCSSAIKSSLRSDSIGIRYGGEEFVVLAKSTVKEAAFIASRISDAFIKKTGKMESIVGHKTLSIGISKFNPDSDFFEVFDQADKALYFAKTHGKNQYVVFDNIVAKKNI